MLRSGSPTQSGPGPSSTWSGRALRFSASPLLAPSALIAALLFVALQLDPFGRLTPYNDKRVLELALLAGLGLWLALHPPLAHDALRRLAALPRAALAGLGLVLLLGAVSAASSTSPADAFEELLLLALLLVAGVAISTREDEASVRRAVLLLVLVALAYGLRFLVSLAAGIAEGIPLLQREMFWNVEDPRFLNQVQTWTLPLLALPFLAPPAGRRRALAWASLAVTALWWMMAIAGGSRGTLLAVTIGLLTAAAVIGRPARRWLLINLAVAALGIGLYGLAFEGAPRGLETGAKVTHSLDRPLTSPYGRDRLWRDAWAQARSAPLLGAGPRHYACRSLHAPTAAHPHNAVLQMAAEWGLPATTLAVGLHLWFLGRAGAAARARRHAGPSVPVMAAVLASLVAGSFHALFSGIVVMPLSQILLALVYGWASAVLFPLETAPAAGRQRRYPPAAATALALVAVAAAAALVVLVAPDVHALHTVDNPLDRIEPPRFWADGWICR